MPGGRLAIALAIVVTVVWVIGYSLAYMRQTPFPSELSALEAIVLGWALGGGIADAVKRRNGKGGGES